MLETAASHKRAREQEGEEGSPVGRPVKQSRTDESAGQNGSGGVSNIDELFDDGGEDDYEDGGQQGANATHGHESGGGQPHANGHECGGSGGPQSGWAHRASGAGGGGGGGGGVLCNGQSNGAGRTSRQLRCGCEGERLEETQRALRAVHVVGAQAASRGIGRGDLGAVQQVRVCRFVALLCAALI